MATTSLRVRMYRVGFGDFFLLTLLPRSKDPKHILIDCGVTKGAVGSLGEAVKDMAKVTGGNLSLIIVSHRHKDHISGFASCAKEFREFTVGSIWMSYWDDPRNPKAVSFQNSLTRLALQIQFQARLALDAKPDERISEALERISLLTGVGSAAAGADESLTAMAGALALLRGAQNAPYQFKSAPPTFYYGLGQTPKLPKDLADLGLAASILGPPVADSEQLKKERGGKEHEYLDLAPDERCEEKIALFGEEWRLQAKEYPPEALGSRKPEEIKEILEKVQADGLLAMAGKIGVTVNNQSLVVLFTFKGKKLLFTGDAEWGGWESFLYGKRGAQSPKLLGGSEQILKTLDFYKVGHHGSTNATPIDAVRVLRKGSVAMCSTEPDAFGKERNGTEIPRKPLMAALAQRSKLVRSDQVPAGKKERTKGLQEVTEPFRAPSGRLYIDYEL